jgi:hypothetical protein
MNFDVIGDLITNERQRKQFVLDNRIVGLLGKVPIQGRLAPHTVRPIMHAEHRTVELGAVPIHSEALSSERLMREADVGSQPADTICFRSQQI